MSRHPVRPAAPRKTPPEKESGGRALLAFLLAVIAVAAIGAFALAERRGLTGTDFFRFLDEGLAAPAGTGSADAADRSDRAGGAPGARDGKKSSAAAPRAGSAAAADAAAGDSRQTPARGNAASGAGGNAGRKNAAAAASSRAPTRAKAPAEAPTPPFPVAAFAEISRRPATWPPFVRLTRARTISLLDSATGTIMGKMDVPAGTLVKVRKVNANGSLDVFDRTGQNFRVEASGTNFSAAFVAYKNKPKKKAPAKKKAPEKKVVADAKKPAKETPAAKKETSPAKGRISAFGTVIDEDEWDDADDY